MFKKVSILEELPPFNEFVVTIDSMGEMLIYRLTEYGWNMRDGKGDNSPNDNFPIKYWLKEIKE